MTQSWTVSPTSVLQRICALPSLAIPWAQHQGVAFSRLLAFGQNQGGEADLFEQLVEPQCDEVEKQNSECDACMCSPLFLFKAAFFPNKCGHASWVAMHHGWPYTMRGPSSYPDSSDIFKQLYHSAHASSYHETFGSNEYECKVSELTRLTTSHPKNSNNFSFCFGDSCDGIAFGLLLVLGQGPKTMSSARATN